jgi:molecular chaperone HscB
MQEVQEVESFCLVMGAINNTEPRTASGTCWSCGAMRAAHFCGECGKVQPARPVDYFSFFGLPRKLNVNTGELEREFYRLSRKLHPDLYVHNSGEEQSWSLQKSSMLNDAYRTLKDPVLRTQYLLKLEGVQLEEQSQAATEQARQSGEQKKQVVPPEMLEEVFELNMQLEEARMNRKMGEVDAQLQQELDQKKNEFENRLEQLFEELKGYWNGWDALIAGEQTGEAVPDEERQAVRDRMVDLLNRRSYIRNLVRDVNEVLEE